MKNISEISRRTKRMLNWVVKIGEKYEIDLVVSGAWHFLAANPGLDLPEAIVYINRKDFPRFVENMRGRFKESPKERGLLRNKKHKLELEYREDNPDYPDDSIRIVDRMTSFVDVLHETPYLGEGIRVICIPVILPDGQEKLPSDYGRADRIPGYGKNQYIISPTIPYARIFRVFDEDPRKGNQDLQQQVDEYTDRMRPLIAKRNATYQEVCDLFEEH